MLLDFSPAGTVIRTGSKPAAFSDFNAAGKFFADIGVGDDGAPAAELESGALGTQTRQQTAVDLDIITAGTERNMNNAHGKRIWEKGRRLKVKTTELHGTHGKPNRASSTPSVYAPCDSVV